LTQIIIPSTKSAHKERHAHRCPIHRKGKCENKCEGCDRCTFQEDNEICGKVLRGTKLEFHDYPCVACQTHWRGAFGGDLLVDALVSLEQAARHAKVVQSKHLDAREAHEAHENDEVENLVDATRSL
jgi:hypothetical protein